MQVELNHEELQLLYDALRFKEIAYSMQASAVGITAHVAKHKRAIAEKLATLSERLLSLDKSLIP